MAHDHDIDPENDKIHPLSKKLMFLGNQKFIDNFVWLIVIGLVITSVLGLVFPFYEKHKAPWDFFASWALIGGGAYAILVLCADPLFKLLSRDEDYYGEGGDDD